MFTHIATAVLNGALTNSTSASVESDAGNSENPQSIAGVGVLIGLAVLSAVGVIGYKMMPKHRERSRSDDQEAEYGRVVVFTQEQVERERAAEIARMEEPREAAQANNPEDYTLLAEEPSAFSTTTALTPHISADDLEASETCSCTCLGLVYSVKPDMTGHQP
jgi:hypothetical protein